MSSNDQRQPQTLNPVDVQAPRPTFSHVSVYTHPGPSKIIHVAGQAGIDFSTGQTPESFEDQVRVALQNLEKCLAAAGATKRDIVKVNQYVVDFDLQTRVPGKMYLEWIGDHRPPSTLIPVQKLAVPEWLYEIDAQAIVPAQ